MTIDNHRTTVRTAKDGTWRAVLPAMNYGGPYTMTVTTGKESLTVSDILVGEVWVASGQSNMEFRLCSADNAEEAALSAHNSGIRVFKVERTIGLYHHVVGYHSRQLQLRRHARDKHQA